jgi:hypothetical protein
LLPGMVLTAVPGISRFYWSFKTIEQQVSTWLDTSILMSDYRVCHRELVHDFVNFQFLRPRGASVNGNWSTPYFLLYYMRGG